MLARCRWTAALAATTLAATLLAPLAVRAQSPANPLRPSPTVRLNLDVAPAPTPAERDVFAEVEPNPIRPVVANEDLPPPQPPSVVPPQFGEAPGPYDGPRYGYLPADHAGQEWPAAAPAQHAMGSAWHRPWFSHDDPNDPYRHIGVGKPLVGTSWLNRPWYWGLFLGTLLADDPIPGEVLSNNSFFIGTRIGWDFDHYWGLEWRYGFSRPQINDNAGIKLPDPANEYFTDISLEYYPWGDSRWRPYMSLGLGVQTFRFADQNDTTIHQSLLSLPIGIGVKYLYDRWCTIRFDAYDNIAFGDGRLDTMHNFTLMMGAEFRFGGRAPVNYFPWHGNMAGW